MINDIKSGYFEIDGEAVKEHQTKMMELFTKGDTICATDLTTHPERLLGPSRARYHRENKEFIEKGGIIKRIFIVDGRKILNKDLEYIKDLYRVFNLNLSYNVMTGLLLDLWLEAGQKKDVIIYSNKSCILEGTQLSVENREGYSTLCFRKSEIEEKQQLFDTLWNYPLQPQNLALDFLKTCTMDMANQKVIVNTGNLINFVNKLNSYM